MIKKLIVILVFCMSFFVFADTYEFSETELRDYTGTIVETAYDAKDAEIVILIKNYDLKILERDKDIRIQKEEIIDLAKKNLDLRSLSSKQSAILKWSPVVVVTTFLTGTIVGLLTARNI